MNVPHGGNIFEISRARGWDWRAVADFSASINPLGPSPAVAGAIRSALDRIPHYPEREPLDLRAALARLWRVRDAQILLGNGATELLHWLARVAPQPLVTLAEPVFSEFHRAYPEARFAPAADPARWPRQGLLVLTQPNNPTGQALCPEALERWLLGTSNPVLLDESFLDFTGLPSAARLLERRPQLWILRSLTKFYALPGLRIGALLASEAEMNRWRPWREPWQVNVLADAAAMAAIADGEHSRRTLQFVAEERAWLSAAVAALPGAHPAPSKANYILVCLDHPADPLVRHLLERQILVRDCTGTPGVSGDAIRIAVRSRAENERLITAWKEFVCAV
jgi:threonine-phosphate decarboxylase